MPYGDAVWRTVAILFPLVSFSSIALFAAGLIPGYIFSFLFTCFLIIGFSFSSKITATHQRLSRIVDEVSTLQSQLLQFEQLQPRSQQLVALQQQLLQNGKATRQIQQLQQVLNWFDFRLNIVVFIFLNSFLLWDLQQVLALHKWRNKYSDAVGNWLQVLAEIEVYSTMANLTFNHPDWHFPVLTDDFFTLHTTDAGHPLIRPEKRVSSSFAMAGKGKVSIVTGSNMGGKSTFLRSTGINIVLAQAGAPVCAKQFTLSPVQLYSSMRIADNLAESTSTFYAELKKLKIIIEQVNQKNKVFILLDEILRGTNSLDRHTGSDALIRQLLRQEAVAIVATHDVELAALENTFPLQIANYYFDVQVAGEELYFDYTLKQGVCTSMNAYTLMKKIGIDLA
jgi:hypothetical protein